MADALKKSVGEGVGATPSIAAAPCQDNETGAATKVTRVETTCMAISAKMETGNCGACSFEGDGSCWGRDAQDRRPRQNQPGRTGANRQLAEPDQSTNPH